MIKLSEQQMIQIRTMYASGEHSTRELAALYDISCATVSNIVGARKRFSGLFEPICDPRKSRVDYKPYNRHDKAGTKVSDETVLEIREKAATGQYSASDLAKLFDLRLPYVWEICKFHTRKNVLSKKKHLNQDVTSLMKKLTTKLSNQEAAEIREMYSTGNFTQQQIADLYKTSRSNVAMITTGKSRV